MIQKSNLKLQLQQLQEKQQLQKLQKQHQHYDNIKKHLSNDNNTNNINNKECIVKGQCLNMNTKDNFLSQIQFQDSTIESNQFVKQQKHTQNDPSLQSDIFNTSNNIKTQGVLGLKFSNTFTQLVQAKGEKQCTVPDNYTLESVETLNSHRSNRLLNQYLQDNQENHYQNQQTSQKVDQDVGNQKRRYSVNNNNNNYETQQKNCHNLPRKNYKNNIPQKIESSEERIISACQLNFDDQVNNSSQNNEFDQSGYAYNENNNNDQRINSFQENSGFSYRYSSNMNEKANPLQQQNFQKKKNDDSHLREESGIKEAIEYQKQQFLIQKQQYEQKMQQQIENQKRAMLLTQPQQKQNYQLQAVTQTTQYDEENEGVRQKLKSTKDVYMMEQGHQNMNRKEIVNTINLGSQIEENKQLDDIFTTNSDLPSTIAHKSLNSEASNIFEKGYTLNDYPYSKNQMSFINEVEEEYSQKSKRTARDSRQQPSTFNNSNNTTINNQYQNESSYRIVTLNPNQDAFDDYLQNKNTNVPVLYDEEEDTNPSKILYNNPQIQYQFLNQPSLTYQNNNTYNTPTLRGGRLSENTFESMDFQQLKQNNSPSNNVCSFELTNNENVLVQKPLTHIAYPSMFENSQKQQYQESQASVCNEMQEIYCNKNDKPQLKSQIQPNKVSNPALLSSHATEENNSFLLSKRNNETPNKDSQSDRYNCQKSSKIYGMAQQEDEQTFQNKNQQIENQKSSNNLKQEQFLQQYESKRPHFLSQEIQIPLISSNYNKQQNQEENNFSSAPQQVDVFEVLNTFSKDQFDDEFAEKLNSIVCDAQIPSKTEKPKQQGESASSLPWAKDEQQQHQQAPILKRDSEPFISQASSSNVFISQQSQYQNQTNNNNNNNNNNTTQIFTEFQQQRIQKYNQEIRQKLKQISYSYCPLNSTVQISSAAPNQSFIDPDEKSFNKVANNQLLYEDINPSFKKSENVLTQIQESSSSSMFMQGEKTTPQQMVQASTQLTVSSALNKKSISNSRYEKQQQIKDVFPFISQQPSPKQSQTLSQFEINQTTQQQKARSNSAFKNSKPTPQLDANLSSDDLEINPFDVISPQEKIANYISFQNGQQPLGTNPHQYPSFQQPPESNSNIPLFVNQETETCLQQITLQHEAINIPTTTTTKRNTNTIKQDSLKNTGIAHIVQNIKNTNPAINNTNLVINNSNLVINNSNLVINNSKAKINNEYFTQTSKNSLNHMVCNLDSILPPSCSSKSSNGTNSSANPYQNVFSYKQFMMNMKKTQDQNILKQCVNKQKNNESFTKKSQVVKKPIMTTFNEKAVLSKDHEKLNKLIDKQIEKNVIRPILSRNKEEKQNNKDQENIGRKASHFHYTASTQNNSNNPHSIPSSRCPVPEMNNKGLDLDVSLRHYKVDCKAQLSSNKSSMKNTSQPQKSLLNTPKSQVNTPKSTNQTNSSFLNQTKDSRRNTNYILNDISYTSSITPSTSKSNLNRNNSFQIPKNKYLNNNLTRENSQNDKCTSSKSPLSRNNSFTYLKSNKNLMITTTIGKIPVSIDKCFDEGLSTNTNHSKRRESNNLVRNFRK